MTATGAPTGLPQLLRRRRMLRRYDPVRPVPQEAVEALLQAGLGSPSAGFTQGISFLVVETEPDRADFWQASTGAHSAGGRWLEGMRTAPLLIMVWTSEVAYLDRYAAPDKGWTDRDPEHWSAPYWFVDAGMATMAILLSAVDRELGACFFGVPPERVNRVRKVFGVPSEQLSVGVISVGYPVKSQTEASGSPTRRARRPQTELVHRGRWQA